MFTPLDNEGGAMIPPYLTEERSALEMVSRQHCQTARLSDRVILCRILGKYIMYADPEDVGITPHFCLNGFWESWITIAMARVLKPGWNCVDVGANHGYYTLIIADAVGPFGRVLAIEPNPQLTELVKLSLEVNGFQRHTTVLQKAVSDTDLRRINLVVPRNRGAMATLCREATVSDDVVEVETVTLDEVTEDWPRVDLIKIDAEGSEESIWCGMRKTLEQNYGITIIMEISCLRYTDPQAFVHEIQEAGFPLRYIDYDGAINNVTEERILNDRVGEDWMLFLRRG
jgi:FkbM family methyltransferase